MRADRLLSLLLFLQSRGKVTAAQVAAELEISIATARRDLEALSAAGVPVTVQPGRGGGWRLIGGARTNLTGLSGGESRALFWMLGTAGLAGPDTRLATRKLIRALPESLRAEAEVLATRIHYDHASWAEIPRSGERFELLETLRTALVRKHVVEFSYVHRDGSAETLPAAPLGLVAKAGIWYFVAHSDMVRTYRVDRIVEVKPTDPATPLSDVDTDFDLAAYWAAHVDEVEALRSTVTSTISCPHWTVPILRAHFGRYFTVVEESSEFTIAEVQANLVVALAEQLAGWGRTIEVLSPPELRHELARIGAELVEYNDHASTTHPTQGGTT
ncbi:helix-turn-helix transcriptional regulator [Brevibacterium sp. GP-SGM9]|uniref:helix-turn-helix transcriptional regulator n=1 Tax=unclassified Brevibacterium TaxID=2614124 RepID=UPI0022A9401D|nr:MULTISPECIES: WYL domain-containing protein [unclassified Brevibacterium]MCD1285561.1 transcriptional regulator [Brevibacterium sp. CCUG 69071]MDK8434615.1 WYL domain-containing protein [Brevibacterium sp. H-BE7]